MIHTLHDTVIGLLVKDTYGTIYRFVNGNFVQYKDTPLLTKFAITENGIFTCDYDRVKYEPFSSQSLIMDVDLPNSCKIYSIAVTCNNNLAFINLKTSENSGLYIHDMYKNKRILFMRHRYFKYCIGEKMFITDDGNIYDIYGNHVKELGDGTVFTTMGNVVYKIIKY